MRAPGAPSGAEADWNEALRALQAAQDDYNNAAASTAALTKNDTARIRALAADFPALWSDPATPQRERNAWPGCSSTTSP